MALCKLILAQNSKTVLMSVCCIVILIHTEASAPWCFIFSSDISHSCQLFVLSNYSFSCIRYTCIFCVHTESIRSGPFGIVFGITAVFEDLACVRQKRKFWSRVNYQETFAHTRIRFGHVRARVVYTTSAFRCFMQDLRKPLYFTFEWFRSF